MRSVENERLVFFSDAIIAVTITLLALDIRLPDGPEGLSEADLISQILAMWPRIFAYILSFLVIALFWMAHRRKFETFTGSHVSIVWLNFLFLLLLGLIPFATDVLAENGGLVATVFYAGLVAVISLVLSLISVAAEHNGLLAREADHPLRERMLIPSLATTGVFAGSIPIAFIQVELAQFFWFAAFPLNIYLARRARARKAAPPTPGQS